MAVRSVVAIDGKVVPASLAGKAKATFQFVALGLAMLRLPDQWGPFYLDEYWMWLNRRGDDLLGLGLHRPFPRYGPPGGATGRRMTVLVTGGTGVVGTPVVRLSSRGGAGGAGPGPVRRLGVVAGRDGGDSGRRGHLRS